jgi:hypothetical protein
MNPLAQLITHGPRRQELLMMIQTIRIILWDQSQSFS